MSRVGKNPVPIPKGVEVKIKDNSLSVKGAKGSMLLELPSMLKAKVEDNSLKISCESKTIKDNCIYGLFRAKINNMVIGVSQGFHKELQIVGVGYRAAVAGSTMNLQLGFSHPVVFNLPKGITASVEKNTLVKLSSIDKELLGEIAAKLRGIRKPEPYKGKGVKYVDEHILRKAGKVAGGAKGAK